MKITSSKFVISNTDYLKCPDDDRPEFAFIGRSNVGKSSLINALTDRKSLAKTSSTPGKTQLINHFLINDVWFLVDLPGYGWAKVSKSFKEKWELMTKEYLTKRKNLTCVFVLIDIRHKAQANDLEFINWLGQVGVPFSIIFTKADKLSKAKVEASLESYSATLLETWEELPPMHCTSAVTKKGKEEVLKYIQDIINKAAK
jgi:GTP-binding protein